MKFEEFVKVLCELSDAQARLAEVGDDYAVKVLLAEQSRLKELECVPVLIKFASQDDTSAYALKDKSKCPNKKDGHCSSCDRFVGFDFRDIHVFPNGEKAPYDSEHEKEFLEYVDKVIPHESCLQMFSAIPQDTFIGYCFKEAEESVRQDMPTANINFQGYDDKLKCIMYIYADAFKRGDREVMEGIAKECNIARDAMERILAERRRNRK